MQDRRVLEGKLSIDYPEDSEYIDNKHTLTWEGRKVKLDEILAEFEDKEIRVTIKLIHPERYT